MRILLLGIGLVGCTTIGFAEVEVGRGQSDTQTTIDGPQAEAPQRRTGRRPTSGVYKSRIAANWFDG